jgi:hypothetical protein
VYRVNPALHVEKEVVRAAVFGPSWALPTMTPEEAAERDAARAAAAERDARAAAEEARRWDGADPAPRAERSRELRAAGREDDADAMDAAAARDRAWDDWSDDHPRGMGVTKRV